MFGLPDCFSTPSNNEFSKFLIWVCCCQFLFFIYWKSRVKDRDLEPTGSWFTSHMATATRIVPDQSQELGAPFWLPGLWQGHKYLGHHALPSRVCICRKLEPGRGTGTWTRHSEMRHMCFNCWATHSSPICWVSTKANIRNSSPSKKQPFLWVIFSVSESHCGLVCMYSMDSNPKQLVTRLLTIWVSFLWCVQWCLLQC